MDLLTIQNELKKIKQKGWIKSKKPNNKDGGAGNTLENLLDIKENNLSSPDLGEIELKTFRTDRSSSSLITLFTFNNKVWKMNQLEAIEKYGSKNSSGRMGLYYTLNKTPNDTGLFTYIDNDQIEIRNVDGNIIISYDLSDLVNRFNRKVKSILLVYFNLEERDGEFYFYYNRARLLKGGTTKEILKSMFDNEIITIDLRLHPKKNKNNSIVSRNHGTGFRVKENNLEQLYNEILEIKI